MESSFLKLKQAIVSDDVSSFDALVVSILDTSRTSNAPVQYCQTDSNGYTLLHWASHLLKPVFVKRLLEFGVPIKCQDATGKTALHRAIERSQVDPEEIFASFASYASPHVLSLCDRSGRTALHSASIKGFTATVDILLTRGANPTARDKLGWTCLHFACFYNRLSTVKLLLAASATHPLEKNSPRVGYAPLDETLLSIESKDGWNALHAASSQGHEDVVLELLNSGADPNKCALHGQTALHVACLNNHAGVVKILREHDADYRIPDKSGLSSLASAQKDVRAVLRKTNTKMVSSSLHSCVIGMPHHPIAERECKFAIQARDKWNRRRTQGGDAFEISISFQPENATSNNGTPLEAPTAIAKSPLVSVQVSQELFSGSRSSGHDSVPENRSPPKTQVYKSDDPRQMLKASQSNSTSSVFAISTPKEAKSAQFARSSVQLSPSVAVDDSAVPRAVSDMARNRASTGYSANAVSRLSSNSDLFASSFALKDLESGLYILKWRPACEGTYRVSIAMKGGVEIQGSPIFVAVAPARTRMPPDLRRIVGSTANSPKSGRPASPLSNSDEDSLTLRTQSTPVDLITSNRPDMTPKPSSNIASQSAPVIKKEKGKKSKGVSTSIIVSSPLLSPASPPPSVDGNSRKRSSSTTSQKSVEMVPQPLRDRSTTAAPSPEGKQVSVPQNSTEQLRASRSGSTSQPVSSAPEAVAAPSSSSRDRNLYRMESTFSPLKPLPSTEGAEELPEAVELAKEVKVLEATVLELNRQMNAYVNRIQELETDQIINARKHEEMHAEDRGKMTKLAIALRAERNSRLCKGCSVASKNAVAVPCLHLSHCNKCIEHLENCPVCGTRLKGFITAQLGDGELPLATPR